VWVHGIWNLAAVTKMFVQPTKNDTFPTTHLGMSRGAPSTVAASIRAGSAPLQ